ncbi:hypothetical protein M404DRAFT_1006318 [Pisolithus tinctorius Marx 270]|uniref:Uncharacterized protein n=1 Tax=Pisolithus tinctorius Marx 270 TaxID=870435 RepID=A0A0C3N7L3_PISTI|nr:hypothetical protein M404DRAFT_1006318 [Pisolithus tinctorius Marx 270]
MRYAWQTIVFPRHWHSCCERDVAFFSSITQLHEEYEKELELASARIKKLQAENEYVSSCFVS